MVNYPAIKPSLCTLVSVNGSLYYAVGITTSRNSADTVTLCIMGMEINWEDHEVLQGIDDYVKFHDYLFTKYAATLSVAEVTFTASRMGSELAAVAATTKELREDHTKKFWASRLLYLTVWENYPYAGHVFVAVQTLSGGDTVKDTIDLAHKQNVEDCFAFEQAIATTETPQILH